MVTSASIGTFSRTYAVSRHSDGLPRSVRRRAWSGNIFRVTVVDGPQDGRTLMTREMTTTRTPSEITD